MNPYLHLEAEKGLTKDKSSPFYGRFRMVFNQVYPFYELTYSRVFIRLKSVDVDSFKRVYNTLPPHLQRCLALYNQKSIRANQYIEIDCFDDDTWFITIDMLGDVEHIVTSNYYFALKLLSPFLEDCCFYIYSSGDLDDRWLDEYKLEDGCVNCSRYFMKTNSLWGASIFYLEQALKRNDSTYTRFAMFQLYDELYSCRDDKEYGLPEKNKEEYFVQSLSLMSPLETENIGICLDGLHGLDLDVNLEHNLDKLYQFNLLTDHI